MFLCRLLCFVSDTHHVLLPSPHQGWVDLLRSPSPLPTWQRNLPYFMPLFFFLPFSFLSAWPCLLFLFFSTPNVVIYPSSLIFFQPFYSNRRAKKMMFLALKWTQCFRKELSIWIHYPKRSTAGESEPRRKISKAQQDSL